MNANTKFAPNYSSTNALKNSVPLFEEINRILKISQVFNESSFRNVIK